MKTSISIENLHLLAQELLIIIEKEREVSWKKTIAAYKDSWWEKFWDRVYSFFCKIFRKECRPLSDEKLSFSDWKEIIRGTKTITPDYLHYSLWRLCKDISNAHLLNAHQCILTGQEATILMTAVRKYGLEDYL